MVSANILVIAYTIIIIIIITKNKYICIAILFNLFKKNKSHYQFFFFFKWSFVFRLYQSITISSCHNIFIYILLLSTSQLNLYFDRSTTICFGQNDYLSYLGIVCPIIKILQYIGHQFQIGQLSCLFLRVHLLICF